MHKGHGITPVKTSKYKVRQLNGVVFLMLLKAATDLACNMHLVSSF